MGVLGNLDHERFCQAVHTRTWAGEKRSAALPAAYRETMYRGDREKAVDDAIYPNARRLSQRKEIKARLSELADRAGKLAGIDAAWAMLRLKGLVEANLDDYLSAPDDSGSRFFDLGKPSRETIGRLSELQIEDETILGKPGKEGARDEDDRRVRKTKLKLHDPVAALRLMAQIAGWQAPTKQELSGPNGASLVPVINLLGRPQTPDDPAD